MTNQRSQDEFYVNYGKIPPGFMRHLLWFVPLLVAIAIALAFILPGIHTHFNNGRSIGRQKIVGLLETQPVPHLLVPRSGDTRELANYSRYLMMGGGKTAPKASILEQEGKWIELTGIPFHRNTLTGIASLSAEPVEEPANVPEMDRDRSLGEFSLVGEIVDSKCYPGVMKPGRTHTHRGCAIRCISGGVPPVFIVENAGNKLYFVLADREGMSVGDRVLDKVADPLRITGEVIQRGDMFILQADPQTYELL